jgi:hypothetical protein
VIQPSLVIVSQPSPPDFELRVNFGMLAGREATRAELDDLAQQLLPVLGEVTIVAERRTEVDEHAEAELHQVRIDLAEDAPLADVVEIAERWAETCFADRHAEVSEP